MTTTADLPLATTPPDPKTFWAKVRRVVGKVPFVEDAVAAYYCALDGNTPPYVRAVLLGAVGYFVLPTDMVPDFLAVVGFTDDATIIAAALAAVGRHITPEHRTKARDKLRTWTSA